MRRAMSLLLVLLLSLSAVAQRPSTVSHRCWDIEITPQQHGVDVVPPYNVANVDTGVLLVTYARQFIGTPYRFGGRTPKAFDCAGFALYLYRQFGYDLPGWSGAQAKLGIEVSDTRNLQAGDLVFFGGRHHTKTVGHTGIVVDTDVKTGVFRFIHASTGAGVIISKSTEPYYKQRYITARRLLK